MSLLVLATLASTACREAPLPSYLRVEGVAPSLAWAPPGRASLVMFWASWCPPCLEETPQLRTLAAAPPEGLQVVVLSHDPDMATVERFLGGVPGLHLRLDADRAAARAFGVERLPTSVLVVDGRLVARFEGPRQWDSRAMHGLLQRLLRETAASTSRPAR